MPTYERVENGRVVERSTTLLDHPSGFDEQMARLAADPGNGWRLADEPPAAEPAPARPEPVVFTKAELTDDGEPTDGRELMHTDDNPTSEYEPPEED